MRKLIALLFSIGIVAWLSSPVALQERNLRGAGGPPQGGFVEERGGFDISGPYEVDPNWPKKTWPAPGYIWGSQAGVYPESADKVFLVSRGEIELPKDLKIPPGFPGNWGALNRGGATGEVPVFRNTILIVDRQGNLIDSWKQWDYLFEGGRGPHQIYVQPYDPERHVWIVDDMNHVIHKFTNDGKTKVFTLGEMGVFGPNDDLQHFNRPTMIDWLPDGTFFVSDGYANSRVVKFSKEGKPLLWWGSMQPGKGRRRVHGAARDRGWRRSPRVRVGPLQPQNPGVRRERRLPGQVAERLLPFAVDEPRSAPLVLRRRPRTVREVRPARPYRNRLRPLRRLSRRDVGRASDLGRLGRKPVRRRSLWRTDTEVRAEAEREPARSVLRPGACIEDAGPAHLHGPHGIATTRQRASARPNPNTPIPNFAGTWNFDKSKSQMAASGGMGNGSGGAASRDDGDAERRPDLDRDEVRGRGRPAQRPPDERGVHAGRQDESGARSGGCEARVQLQADCEPGTGRGWCSARFTASTTCAKCGCSRATC